MYSGIIFSRSTEPPEDARLPRSCWAFYDRVDGSTSTAAIADALNLSAEETFAAVHSLQSHGLIEEAVVTYEAYHTSDSGQTSASSGKTSSTDAVERSADADKAGSSVEAPPADKSRSVDTGGAPSGDGSAPASSAPSLYPEEATSTEGSVEDDETGNDSTEGASANSASAGDEASSGEQGAEDATADTPDAGTPDAGTPDAGTPDAGTTDASTGLHLPSFWTWLEKHAPNVKEYKNTQAFILMETSGPLSRIGIDSMDDLQELERCDDPEVVEALEAAVENNLNESIPPSCYQ